MAVLEKDEPLRWRGLQQQRPDALPHPRFTLFANRFRVSASPGKAHYSPKTPSRTVSEAYFTAQYIRFQSTLSSCSQTHPPYCIFSGLGGCPNNRSHFSSPSPEEVPTSVDTRAFLEWTIFGTFRRELTPKQPYSPKFIQKRISENFVTSSQHQATADYTQIGGCAQYRRLLVTVP
jgi:hypothetical protein